MTKTSNKKQKMANCPIGIFDSGLGGLTVVKEVIRQLPNEDIVYFGDTARVPYGTKSKETIIQFSKENTEILLEHKVKMVVVACNTSSSYALTDLKKRFTIPILGVIEPGVKKALSVSKTKKIGVIATSATINSQSYLKKLKSFDKRVSYFGQACPLFVPLVEEGRLSGEITRLVAKEYLSPLLKAKIDTLILGCTHYPLLKDLLNKVVGPKVDLIDSARVVAEEVQRLLRVHGLEKQSATPGKCQFLISDRPQQFDRIAKNFLGWEIKSSIRRV